MKGYAYLDKYGILHIVNGANTPPTGAKVVGTELTRDGGLPTVKLGKKYKKVYMYSVSEAYVGGNRNSYEAGTAKRLDFEVYPQILELYKKCM